MASLTGLAHAAAVRLQQAGLSGDDAAQSAGILARAVLGWTTAEWLARSLEIAPAGFSTKFNELIYRRSRREPVAYLLGQREFYGRTFAVNRDVLIPRPETELIVDEALRWPEPVRTIADIGTGSGCIAVTLSLERPSWRVFATDVSPAALDVARDNARRLEAPHIEFIKGSLVAEVPGGLDLIVSNPPYVAERDRASLAADVVDFEPTAALFGGKDGLDVIRPLAAAAANALASGGGLILEIGQGQADAVSALLEATGALRVLRVQRDLQGIPRTVVARRN